MNKRAAVLLAAVLASGFAPASHAATTVEQIAELAVPEANQGVGVDERHFYAVDNQAIGKYDKATGKLVEKWQGPSAGPIVHLDSAMLMDGKLYAAHSNYPGWPMTSSVEIFDAEHDGARGHAQLRRPLGLADLGGLARRPLVDDVRQLRPEDRARADALRPQGEHRDGQAHADFEPVQAWTLPKAILDRFEDMSNSGGSWGPDGFLYLTGHDPAEVYKMTVPETGSVLQLVEIIPLNIRGQGIAWDRSQPGIIYGIIRATAAERGAGIENKVTVSRIEER